MSTYFAQGGVTLLVNRGRYAIAFQGDANAHRPEAVYALPARGALPVAEIRRPPYEEQKEVG